MPGGLLGLLAFVLLAVLTNTAFPMPFDHVLIWFTSRHPGGAALGYAALGSACAGAAALPFALWGWGRRRVGAPRQPSALDGHGHPVAQR